MVPQPDISQTAAGLRMADSVEGRKRITESRVRTVSIETVANKFPRKQSTWMSLSVLWIIS